MRSGGFTFPERFCVLFYDAAVSATLPLMEWSAGVRPGEPQSAVACVGGGEQGLRRRTDLCAVAVASSLVRCL